MDKAVDTVLVVEDNDVDAELVRRHLRGSYRVEVAESAKRALAKLASGLKPVCVLLDHRLPGRDGLSLLPDLVRLSLPVVMLTHVGGEDFIVQAIRLGALAYCHKESLHPELLKVSIRTAIERHKADEFFHLAMNATPNGMILSNREGTILFANQAASVIFDHGGLVGLELGGLLVEASPDATSRGPAGKTIYEGVRSDGRTLFVELRAADVENYRGEACVLSTIIDVTGRIEMERRQRAIEARMLHLMELLPVSVFTFDGQGRPFYTNALGRGLLRRFKGKEASWSVLEAQFCDAESEHRIAPEDAPLARSCRGELIESRDVIIKRDYEQVFYANVNASPLLARSGEIEHVIIVLRETTTTRKMEQELRQAQKMEAVGRLAGGVAHDFNNLLTAILGFGKFTLETLDEGSTAYEDVQEIIQAGERARGLTQQLLAFSRQQAVNPRPLNLNESVSSTLKMLERLVGEDIEMEWCGEQELWTCQMDEGMFEQVLVNLVLNARDAMPSGGEVRIETRNLTLDEGFSVARGVEVPPGDYVCLSVSDSGVGMSPSTLKHIFEPFFTTKESTTRSGTGLGLSTCYGIVKQASGFIWPSSELEVGTTFEVHLPRIQTANEREERGGPVASLEGLETILVVEDNAQVRRLTERVLKKLGYLIIVADDGVDALDKLETCDRRVSLILTDTVMPKMGGVELVRRLAADHRDLKVLFMSGYTQNEIGRNGLVSPNIALLQKPFSPADLGTKVREVLDGASFAIGEVVKELSATEG